MQTPERFASIVVFTRTIIEVLVSVAVRMKVPIDY